MVAREKSVICIVTPGTRVANNGNWRTASRWAAMLRQHCRVIVQSEWGGQPCDALIALHAKRSAASIAAFTRERGAGRVAVVLTGTDLYRDLPSSPEAAASLNLAQAIVVLQEEALFELHERWRRKAAVIFQSARLLAPRRKSSRILRCVAVGHLRAEKDPATLLAAIALLPAGLPIHVRHIGAPLDPALAAAARRLAARDSRYAYAGALPHGLARAAIGSAHLLVHPSIMEGGANVVVEAITAGTAVVASAIAGNIGMLGRDYPGYFAAGDASGLAARLVQACEDRPYLTRLARACRARRALFTPQAEARALRRLVAQLLA